MDLSDWVKTPTVSIDFRENYGRKLLASADGRTPEFRLMPKYLCNGYGEDCVVQFNLTFEHGRMLPNWEELLFTPLGSDPVPRVDPKLPPWSPEQEGTYSRRLDPIITALYANDTRLERLEASLPMYLDHSPESRRRHTIDRVRMVYLKDAVDAENPNLVLVVFSWLDGYKVHQNGAGSGPPK